MIISGQLHRENQKSITTTNEKTVRFSSTLLIESLQRWGSSALQEIGLIRGVKEEMGRLESVMSAIKAVLLDAEEKRIDNHQVRDWLQKLEDAVYDADESVDEFHTEALWRRVTPGGKVRVFFSSSNEIAFRVKMDR